MSHRLDREDKLDQTADSRRDHVGRAPRSLDDSGWKADLEVPILLPLVHRRVEEMTRAVAGDHELGAARGSRDLPVLGEELPVRDTEPKRPIAQHQPRMCREPWRQPPRLNHRPRDDFRRDGGPPPSRSKPFPRLSAPHYLLRETGSGAEGPEEPEI